MCNRIIIGLSAGFTMVTVPLYLSEIAPQKYKTKFGVLHQIWIGLGMITAQSLSIPFSRAWTWRFTLLVGASIALVLLCLSFGMKEVDPDKSSQDEEGGGDEETPLINKCGSFYCGKNLMSQRPRDL
jgi:MFS family permease